MSKKFQPPEDAELRNEFFAKYAASALYDAHIVIIYADESLSAEAGLPSPFKILQSANFKEKRLSFAQFTSQGNAVAELANEEARNAARPSLPAIVLYPALYYGLWGTIFNSSSDAAPAGYFEQLAAFVRRAGANFSELAPANAKLAKEEKIQTRATTQVLTTQTDGICAEFCQQALQLTAHELQGSCRQFVCSKNCSKAPFKVAADFRFPVDQNYEVASFNISQDLGSQGSIPKTANFCDQALYQHAYATLNPPKPAKLDPRKAAQLEAAKKKAESLKKKKTLDRETYPTVWNEDFQCNHEENEVFADFCGKIGKKETYIGQTHLQCPRCGAPLRFNILTTANIPQAYKTWYAALCKDLQRGLPKEMQAIIQKQHNNYEISKKATVGKINCGLKTVILELGYNSTYSKIHQENIKNLVQGRGQTVLIRIARQEDAGKLDYPGLEQFIGNTVQSNDFMIETLFYPIITKKVTDGITQVFNLFNERQGWIASWDDLKQRNAVYGKKK